MPNTQTPGNTPKRNKFSFKVPAKQLKPKAPKLPSRLPVLKPGDGKLNIGLRLGFDKLPQPMGFDKLPQPTAAKKSLGKAKLMNQLLTGKAASGWSQTDKAKLAKAIWEIFSQNIAPDLAKKLTSGLSPSTGKPGVAYELDLALITDFGKEIGGGVQFTVRW